MPQVACYIIVGYNTTLLMVHGKFTSYPTISSSHSYCSPDSLLVVEWSPWEHISVTHPQDRWSCGEDTVLHQSVMSPCELAPLVPSVLLAMPVVGVVSLVGAAASCDAPTSAKHCRQPLCRVVWWLGNTLVVRLGGRGWSAKGSHDHQVLTWCMTWGGKDTWHITLAL